MDKTAFAASFGAPISQTNKGQLPDRRHAFLCMSQTSDARPTNDGLFGRIAIAIFRRVMKPHVGKPSPRIGYDGLVDDCRILLSRKSPREQRQIVLNVLSTLFVSPRGPRLFRERFADKPEINARITPLFFQWLVGPAAVNDPPAETGGRPGAGVFIEKCRFLDESGCKGLCLNMCQQPTQTFFTETLGLPLRMTPDFETKSCQMSFGVQPLPVSSDPAFEGGCLQGCQMTSKFKPDDDARSPERRKCYVQRPNNLAQSLQQSATTAS